MPLSKERNRDRMRLIRLHKHSLSPQECKSVQPKTPVRLGNVIPVLEQALREDAERALVKPREGFVPLFDADGNVIPDE